MIIYTWFHSAVISLPRLFICKVYEIRPHQSVCDEQWDTLQQGQAYLVCYTLFTIFLPLLISCMAYVLVWRAFRISQRKVTVMNVLKRPKSASYVPYASKTEIRLLKMLFLMVFCFVILWAPQVVYLFIRYFDSDRVLSEYFVYVALWVCKIQPVVDPIIYGYLNKHFRRSMRELVHHCSVQCSDMGIDETISSDNFLSPSSDRHPPIIPDPPPLQPSELNVDPTLSTSPVQRVSLTRCYQSNAYSFTFTADAVNLQTLVNTTYPQDNGVFSITSLNVNNKTDVKTPHNADGTKGSRKRSKYLQKRQKKTLPLHVVPTTDIRDTCNDEMHLKDNNTYDGTNTTLFSRSHEASDHVSELSSPAAKTPVPNHAWPADSGLPEQTIPQLAVRLPPIGQSSSQSYSRPLPSIKARSLRHLSKDTTPSVRGRGQIYSVEQEFSSSRKGENRSSQNGTTPGPLDREEPRRKRKRKPILSKRLKQKQCNQETAFSNI